MKRFARIRAYLVLLAPLAFGACGILDSDRGALLIDQLNRAEALWAAEGASAYVMTVTRRCDCPVQPVQVRLEVVDDEIVAARYVDADEEIDPAHWAQYTTVTGMFALARSAIVGRAPIVQLNYDQEYGYINDMVINYDRSRVDDDIMYTVDGYAPASEI